jgi:hypothetical protein
MFVVEGFQKFAGIPFGISRIFESLMPQQISANRRKNRSIQVKLYLSYFSPGDIYRRFIFPDQEPVIIPINIS